MRAGGLFAAAMVETGLVAWRDLKVAKIPPPPSDFVAVAVVFGGLSLFPESAKTFTSLFGWGIVLATFMGAWTPQKPLGAGKGPPLGVQGTASQGAVAGAEAAMTQLQTTPGQVAPGTRGVPSSNPNSANAPA